MHPRIDIKLFNIHLGRKNVSFSVYGCWPFKNRWCVFLWVLDFQSCCD